MINDGVMELLAANSGISALVGTRIYQSVLPRGYTLPAIAVHRYAGAQDYEFDGPVGVREDNIQCDIYGASADSGQTIAELIRALLVPFTGALPDGTVVQACYLDRDMDMPFLPHADSQGIANRTCLGFRIVSQRV